MSLRRMHAAEQVWNFFKRRTSRVSVNTCCEVVFSPRLFWRSICSYCHFRLTCSVFPTTPFTRPNEENKPNLRPSINPCTRNRKHQSYPILFWPAAGMCEKPPRYSRVQQNMLGIPAPRTAKASHRITVPLPDHCAAVQPKILVESPSIHPSIHPWGNGP